MFFLKILVGIQNGSNLVLWERSGSVVECSTRDQGAAGLSLTSVTELWSVRKTHLPWKTSPCLTERLLMGHKESNQTKISAAIVH